MLLFVLSLPHLCTLGRLCLYAQHDCCCEDCDAQYDGLCVAEVVCDFANDGEEFVVAHFL